LPPNGKLLAYSDSTANEIYSVSHNILSFQPHVEWTAAMAQNIEPVIVKNMNLKDFSLRHTINFGVPEIHAEKIRPFIFAFYEEHLRVRHKQSKNLLETNLEEVEGNKVKADVDKISLNVIESDIGSTKLGRQIQVLRQEIANDLANLRQEIDEYKRKEFHFPHLEKASSTTPIKTDHKFSTQQNDKSIENQHKYKLIENLKETRTCEDQDKYNST